MFYVNEIIPCRRLYAEDQFKYFEEIFLESSLGSKKWLHFGLYKSPGQNEQIFSDASAIILIKLITDCQ